MISPICAPDGLGPDAQVACRARGSSELLEEDVREPAVVVLAGVDEAVARCPPRASRRQHERQADELRPRADDRQELHVRRAVDDSAIAPIMAGSTKPDCAMSVGERVAGDDAVGGRVLAAERSRRVADVELGQLRLEHVVAGALGGAVRLLAPRPGSRGSSRRGGCRWSRPRSSRSPIIISATSTIRAEGTCGTKISPRSACSTAAKIGVHRRVEAEQEARHLGQRDRHRPAVVDLLAEQRDHRAARGEDVAVAHADHPAVVLSEVALDDDALHGSPWSCP